jgi:hypothetical protein
MHDGAFSPDGLVEYEHGPLVSFSDYDALRRELAEAQRDAERYRWLKDSEPEVVDTALLDKEPSEWDTAIDAAMAEPESSPPGR